MRALVLVVSVVVLTAVAACSNGPGACSAATCGTCCDSAGQCVGATSDQACGAAGNMCIACDTGFQCLGGRCQRTGSGGGGGGGTAGAGGGTAGSGGSGGGAAGGGGGGGSGGSGGAGGGAAGGAVTCGTAPTAPMIPIAFPTTCPFPTPCGGDPAGTFHYTSACIPQSEFDSYKMRLEQGMGGLPGCGVGSVTIHGYDGGMAGSAVFNAGTVCRTVTGAVTVYAAITTGICANQTACGLIYGQNIQGNSVTCAFDGGVCDCSVTRTINITNAAYYTTGPTTLTVLGSNQTFETCLTGGTVFSTRELDAGSAEHEPGVATLTKQ